MAVQVFFFRWNHLLFLCLMSIHKDELSLGPARCTQKSTYPNPPKEKSRMFLFLMVGGWGEQELLKETRL